MVWMIRNTITGRYSNGIINFGAQGPYVGWSKRGKQWTQEKYLKAHLLKYAQSSSSCDWSTTWEVVEIVEKPTKPIDDWFDVDMVLKILKKVG